MIISLSSPEIETISGPRAINVSLESVIVEAPADSETGGDVCVCSARHGATLFSFAIDEFHGALLSVDAELGYRLASHSNLRRLSGGAPEAVFSVNVVSRSTRFLEPSTTGLLAMVLLAPGIFAFKRGLAFGAWRASEQVSPCVAAAQPENIWGRLSGKMGILLGR